MAIDFYTVPDAWHGRTHVNQLHTNTSEYLRVPGFDTATSFDSQPGTTITPTIYDPMSFEPCPLPSKFRAVDVMAYDHDVATVSPQQTHFRPEQWSPVSDIVGTRGSISSQTSYDSHSPAPRKRAPGRKRKTEDVNPSSARATYLEKNRRAASKCRSKQKRQQEELVEEARNCEHRNKRLKAEVAMLQEGMRELLEVVGQHANCPDTRLKRYVQREADRLASGIPRTSSFSQSPSILPSGHGT